MPDCEYFEELCSASLDGELTRAQKRELDAHLAACPACAAYLEDLKLMRTAWGDLKEPLPEALHEKIMGGIAEEAQKKAVPMERGRKRKPPVFTMIAAAAACVMLVISGAVGDLIGGTRVDPESRAMSAGSAAGDAAMEDIPVPQNDPAAPEDGIAPQADAGEDVPVPAVIGPAEDAVPQTGQSKTSGSPESGNTEPAVPELQSSGASTESQKTDGAPTPFEARTSMAQGNAAASFSVTIPEAIRAHSFGFCYVAAGSSDVPVLEQASLMERDGNTYYYKIGNSMSVLEELRGQLQDAGYETAMRADVGITVDENAEYSLLIVAVGTT